MTVRTDRVRITCEFEGDVSWFIDQICLLGAENIDEEDMGELE